jgi:hypothetical protein
LSVTMTGNFCISSLVRIGLRMCGGHKHISSPNGTVTPLSVTKHFFVLNLNSEEKEKCN